MLTRRKVANRHNYILWLKRLLDTSSYDQLDRKVVGLDIGTGASCIYPLLGCAQRPWSFIATGKLQYTLQGFLLTNRYPDIDAKSLEFATKNVQLNDLHSRIRLVERKPQDPLIPLDELSIDNFDFCMTNPPFYKSEEEMVESAAQKSRPPFTACTGSKTEMVTDGGEVGFVERILRESLALRERVQWYTAMFGFLSSLTSFIEKLREHNIDNFAVTEFVQGNKTRRWALGWSFQPMRPAQEVSRGTKAAMSKNILPAVTEVEIFKSPLPEKIGEFADHINGAIAALDLISWNWDRERLEGTGRAPDKVWARPWRRRKKRELELQKEKPGSLHMSEDLKCVFGFTVFIRVGKEDIVVGCRWREGHDAAIFESFGGFLQATTKQGLGNL